MRCVATMAAFVVVFGGLRAAAQTPEDLAITEAVMRGATARAAGRTDEMRREVGAAARLAGDQLPRLRVLAAALSDHGFPELAVQVCVQALARAPDDATLRGLHGASLVKMRRPVEGVAELVIATTKLPNAANWWIELGRARLHANQEAAALAAIDRAIALAPDNLQAVELLAECEYRNMRLDACEATCKRLLAKQPYNPLALQLTVRVRRMKGRSEEAVALAEAAMKTIGRNPDIVLELGIAQLSANKPAEAAAALEEAASKLPADHRPWLHLCKAYTKLGKAEAAAAAKKRYGELMPDQPRPQTRRSG